MRQFSHEDFRRRTSYPRHLRGRLLIKRMASDSCSSVADRSPDEEATTYFDQLLSLALMSQSLNFSGDKTAFVEPTVDLLKYTKRLPSDQRISAICSDDHSSLVFGRSLRQELRCIYQRERLTFFACGAVAEQFGCCKHHLFATSAEFSCDG